MAQPAPRKSYLILILVVLAAFVVIIAKTSAKHKAGPNPQSQTAQLPAESPVAKIAAAVPADSTTVGAPEPAPPAQPPAADEPEATAKPTPPSEAAPAPKLEPAAGQPSAPSAADPKPPAPPVAEPATPQEPAKKEVQPLPGSKLAECLKSGRPTMVDFGAGWCRPCQMMEPVLVQAATKYEGKANVVYVDTDKYADVARSYRIASIPTQIFFDAKGEKVSQHIGYWPIEDVGRALAAAGVAE